jgi:hypothetical protein
MTPNPERADLLRDVLADSTPAEFRAAVLADMLRGAQRRRFVRRTRPAALALALLTAIVAAALNWNTSHNFRGDRDYPCRIVATRPLAPAQIVATRAFASASPVRVVQIPVTSTPLHGAGIPAIGDAELLALAPAPAALVRTGPHSQMLIVVHPIPGQPTSVN